MPLKPIHLATNPGVDAYFFTESGADGRSQGESGFPAKEALMSVYNLTEEGDSESARNFGSLWVYAIPSEFF